MDRVRTSEKGQILVILVLALLGLLGLTALAVDGGMLYADRRYMQSAADSASLAGAGALGDGVEALDMTILEWNCSALTASIGAGYNAAINKALVNDFVIVGNASLGTAGNNHGIKITCNQADKYADVRVMLTRDTTTSFAQLFTSGPMRNTVSSTTRIRPGLNAAAGYAIVSLSKNCGNNQSKPAEFGGTKLSGTTDVMVITGGIWSNSCIDASGGPDVIITEADKVTVKPDSIKYNAAFPYTPPGSGTLQPEPSSTTALHPLTNMPLPSPGKNCKPASVDPYKSMNNISGTLSAGNYNNLTFKGATVLSPGLYCISGTVFMNASASVSGEGITIFYTGTSMTLNGGVATSLKAPNWEPVNLIKPVGGAIEDLLVYVPPEVQANITINGTSDSVFGGTVYAPSSAIFIAGNATMGHETVAEMALIGYRVDLTGAAYFNIKYNANTDYGFPTELTVLK